ncbi:hypothetical protein SSYRP_v1c05700 [Spiroplasma syrphidicola EA-1]|uniref:Major facilitator superfamily (MFS) profile domain-containing protein n=1 Tax=Spiroplasma syrphidicola EA-1 TaxID=1276229 RepID=R4UJ62_9MOLU|nr:hypothetical protein [Spiroplasma syrphidicola]AGM26160.1 hypothetical protein SSYRP_v1c05700 [Spiroplasma syrphidicola EA-1]
MKNKLIPWKITLFWQGALLGTIFSLLPTIIYFNLGLHWMWLFLLIPIMMFFITPLWMRLKIKIGNQKVLQINSCFLFIFLTTIMIINAFNLNNYLTLFIINLILIGIFTAGLVPFTMEITRSYAIKNEIKFNPNLIFNLGLVSLILIPFLIMFLTKNQTQNIILGSYLGVLGLGNLILVLTNQDIKGENITFNLKDANFKELLKNKAFLKYLFTNSFLNGIIEFFGYVLPILVFPITPELIILIGVLYFIRKSAFLIGYALKISNNNSYRFLVTIISFISLALLFSTFLITTLFTNTFFAWLYFILGLAGGFFGLSFSLGIMQRKQKAEITEIVPAHNFNLAMMIQHVFGNAIISLIISAVCLPLLITFNANNLVILIIYGTFLGIAIISFPLFLSKQKINQ